MRTPVGLKSNPQTRPFVTQPRHAASDSPSGELVATTADLVTQPRHAAVLRLTVLIAAHNEEQSIGATLDSVLAQERLADRIVVEADNCTDATAQIARSKRARSARPFLVHETVGNTHKKSGALNQAWALTRGDTDLFICIDADTVLPPGALRDWEAEFVQDDEIAGCSAKFTMLSAQEM